MDRRVLLLSAACAMLTAPTRADVPVVDLTQVAKTIQQIEWMRDQYQVMTQNLHALTDSLNLNSIVPQLSGAGLQNPLGGVTSQLNGIVGGTTTGNIPGARQMLEQDRFFQPTGTDFTANTLNSSSTGLANLKAMALQLIGVNDQRISTLNAYQSSLEGAADTSQVQRINGQIELENQTLAAQQAQAQQLQSLVALQQQTNDQRALQRIRADDEQLVNDAGSSIGGTGGGPNSGLSGTTTSTTFVGN